MRKVILHIGYPKTGTSSIQAFLRDNREALARLGFHVPSIGQAQNGAHHALATSLAGLPLRPKHELSEGEIIARLSDAPAETVLVSSEKLTGLLTHPLRAERVLGNLRATGATTGLVMYVRNQTQMLSSDYSQRVKSFRHKGDFRANVALVLAGAVSYKYDQWAKRAERYGMELRARPFSERVRKDGVVEDYLKTVDCPAFDSLTPPPRINESVGPFTVEAARRLQHWTAERFGELTLVQANRCKRILEEAIAAAGIAEPRYCGLDYELARTVEIEFKDSNDRFARRMWGSDWRAVYQNDVGQKFESNDYQDTGVPPAMQEPLKAVMATTRAAIETIMKQPQLAVREDWNRLHA